MKLEKLSKLTPGCKVWVKGHHDEYVMATVTSRKGDVLKVKGEDGKSKKYDLDEESSQVFRANERVVADMTSLSHFHIPGILYNLRERAVADEPYTFLGGSVLVAVNPLKRIPDPKNSLGNPSVVNTAHPYAIAETAFQQLAFSYSRGAENQSIVVGGESGAGKTESSKYVLKHLVTRGDGGKDDLDQRLLDSNPILEAFGNAATKRNPNSSRFGKFMKLHFKKSRKGNKLSIYGGSVQTYLLERSRVTSHSVGERSYHVFYQLTNGADKSLRKSLKLDGTFDYLVPKAAISQGFSGRGKKANAKNRQSIKIQDLSKEDKANFKELCNALSTVGISDDGDVGQKELFAILAGLLHLGNINFVENTKGNGDEAKVDNTDVLETASELLGIKPKKLAALFIERKVKTRGEEIISTRDPESAKIALDAVVKATYSGTFDWLVRRITTSLSERGDHEEMPFIGVLDIFGFETFQTNDFEQLLINYTNEALQNTFNEQIFEAEAALYEKEGLLVNADDRAPPPDNFEAMLLLAGKKGEPGVLSIIDAETNSPQASDDKLVSTLHRTFKKNKLFPAPHPKDIKHCFIVKHYAGEVKYTIGKFIEKNFDKLPDEITEVLQASKKSILSEVFSDKGDSLEQASKKVKKKNGTIAGKFKVQIEHLIKTLGETKASFIRCIKPNARMTRGKDASWFNNGYVMTQLMNLSIPQTAEVLQGGLPTRLPFDLLMESYQSILPADAINAWETLGQGDERLFVRALFAAYDIPPDTYKMGATRVFFRAGMLENVNEVLNAASNGAVDDEIVQRFRTFFSRALFRRVAAKMIACTRFLRLLEECRNRQSAVTALQRFLRRRKEILLAQAELARLKAEKAERDRKAAKEAAKAAKAKKEKEAKKRKEAKRREDEEAARLAELQALEEEEAEMERARLAEEKAEKESAKAASFQEQGEAMEQREVEETEKTMKALGGEDGLKKQRAREKKTRFAAETEVIGENEDEDEEDDDNDVNARAEEVKERVKTEIRKSMAGARQVEDFSTLFENVRYSVNQTAPAPARSPFACFSSLFGGGKSNKLPVGDNGDMWPECAIIVSGMKLKLFQDADVDKRGLVQGHGLIDEFVLDPLSCKINKVEGSGEDDGLLSFTVRSSQGRKSFLFKLPPEEAVDGKDANDALMDAYNTAQENFKAEAELAKKFELGTLANGDESKSEEMGQYKQWLKDGLINQDEYNILLNQQITGDDEHLAQDADKYGEEGVRDYRVVCPDCGEIYFILPSVDKMDLITECTNCECPLPSPEELEESANAIRAHENAELWNADKETGYPVSTILEDGRELQFLVPKVIETFQDYQKTYLFAFPCTLGDRNGLEMFEEWDFSASWSQFKFFQKYLADPEQESTSIGEQYLELIPPFPKDVAKQRDKKALAVMRLPLIREWLKELIDVVAEIPGFYSNRFVRKFFLLPVEAKLVVENLQNSVLTLEEMSSIQHLIDEMVAAEQSKEIGNVEKRIDEKQRNTKKLVKSILPQLEMTSNIENVLEAIELEAYTLEEKTQLIQMALNALDVLHDKFSYLAGST